MGQYYYVVNLDKRQYLHPHKFGDGLKLMEFGVSGAGTMAALAILLSQGNGRGLGDFHGDGPLVGSWAGDRIVVAGDYADVAEGEPEEGGRNFYQIAEDEYEDISTKVVKVLRRDEYLRQEMRPAWA